MAKETISAKVEPEIIEVLTREAEKREWTLSYYIESIIKNHVRKNKLLVQQKAA